MTFIIDRIRMVLFGIAITILGAISPRLTLGVMHNVLENRNT